MIDYRLDDRIVLTLDAGGTEIQKINLFKYVSSKIQSYTQIDDMGWR